MRKKIEKVRTLMEKIPSIFYIVFSVIFIVVLFGVLFFNNTTLSKVNTILLLVSVVLYILGMLFIYKFFIKYIKHKKLFIIILSLIFLIIQILFSYIFMVNPSWDFRCVFDSVKDDIAGGKSIFSNWYYYRYDNNLGLAILYKLLFGICNILNIKNYYFLHIGILFNIIIIDISIVYLYKTLKLFLDKNKSYFFLICSLFFLPFITYDPIFYTDTVSMPFIIIGIYYFLTFLFGKNSRKLFLIAGGLSLGIGSCIKFSAVIVLVAFIIYFIFHKLAFKSKLKYLTIIIIFFMIPILSLKVVEKVEMNQTTLDNEKFPLTHWIMMGLAENEYGKNGFYYEPDIIYTASFNGQENKKDANIKVIKTRISNYIKDGKLIDFYLKKAIFIWGDGTFYAPAKLNLEPINDFRVKNIIFGTEKQTLVFRCLSQTQIVLVLLFTILAVLYRKYLDKTQKSVLFLNSIIIFGVFLFFMLWEARSRYIVNYIPVLLIQAYLGVMAITNRIKAKKRMKN